MTGSCSTHTKARAAWRCRGCSRALCELCVAERHLPGGLSRQAATICVHCSGFAEREMIKKRVAPYWEKLGDFGRAMVSTEGATQLIGVAVVRYLVELLPGIGGLLSSFVFVSYYFRVISGAAAGGERLPEPSDFLGPSSILGPVLRFTVASAMIWVPALLYTLLVIGPGVVLSDPAVLIRDPVVSLLLLAGVLYTPAAIITAAIAESVVAVLNPMITIRMILRVPMQYIGVVGIWLGLSVLDLVLNALLNRLGAVLYVPIVTAVVLHILKLPLPIFSAMIMGRLIYQNGDHFGVVLQGDQLEPLVPGAVPKGQLKAEPGVEDRPAQVAVEAPPVALPLVHGAPTPSSVDDLDSLELELPDDEPAPDSLELSLPEDALPAASGPDQASGLDVGPTEGQPVPAGPVPSEPSDSRARRLSAFLARGAKADAVDLFMSEVRGRTYPALGARDELRLSSALEQAGLYDEAARACQRAAKQDLGGPLAPRAIFGVARLMEERLQRLDQALAMYRYLVQHYPADGLAANAEARIKALVGRSA